ncbi:MAG: hypothetical protein L0212_03560 [Acidobacteria bacterium]|nr:hypothetical protein [Acidobacteriota bacterium]
MSVRRTKSYTADTGYVWQYHFEEVRSEQNRDGRAGSEYVFVVSRDRTTSYPVPVFLQRAALEAWAGEHGRSLSGAEQYAAVKMRLFRAFDEIEDLEPERDHIEVTPENIADLLAPLVE